MENFIIYILKVNISLCLMSGLYLLLFRKDTFFYIKRLYLVSCVLFSFSYPFIHSFKSLFHQNSIITNVVHQVYLNPVIITENISNHFNWINLIFIVASFGCITLFIRLLIQTISIAYLRYQNQMVDNIVNVKNKEISPFSFFKWIFIYSKENTENKELEYIIRHEQIHSKQFHSVDILIAEMLCVLFWWNPIVWLLNRELRINLEYIVDNELKKQDIDIKKYQYSLLMLTQQNKIISTAVNHYNFSQLKKRIIMMNRKKTIKWNLVKYALIVPTFLFMISANTLPEGIDNDNKSNIPTETPQESTPYEVVDVMPQFNGGNSELMNFIGTNLKYPAEAIKNKIEGRVVVRFIISKTGKVTNATIVKSLNNECDAEALRVVATMPDWTPGYQNGKAVPVYFSLPIQYSLN